MATTSEQPLPSQLEHTIRTAAINVVWGTAASIALGGAAGAASGVARNAPAIPAAFKTSINTGVFSFTFFSIREYGVIPLLTHFSLHPSSFPSPSSSSPPPPPPSPHTANLLPTFISGLPAGAAFSYFQRGPLIGAATHARAGLTLALGCAVLQGIVNEGDIIRIKMLARGEEERRRRLAGETLPDFSPFALPPSSPSQNAVADPAPTSTATTTSSTSSSPYLTDLTTAPHPSSPDFSDPGRETFSERSDRLIASGWGWTKRQVAKVTPLKRLEDGEYERKLKGVLEGIEEEKKRVRKERIELEGLEAMLAKVDAVREKRRIEEGR